MWHSIRDTVPTRTRLSDAISLWRSLVHALAIASSAALLSHEPEKRQAVADAWGKLFNFDHTHAETRPSDGKFLSLLRDIDVLTELGNLTA